MANRIQELLHINNCPDNIRQKILKVAEFYSLRISSKWKASFCKREVFKKKNDAWLKQTLSLTKDVQSYYMPSTMHKLLIHGPDIISSFDLPIGILSEEALEAKHKEFRKNRLSHTRKSSRLNSNKDLINIMLITSDPFISSLRKVDRSKFTHKNTDISEYIVLPEPEILSYSFNLPPQLNLSDSGSEESDEE